ncbi:MAG: hypothetical protein Q9166_001131 [cf. Caloplaca sp. 2 TL-2023]
MLLLALTGSLSTGKSTVSALLSAYPYSLPIIDADVLARQVVEPGTPSYRKIISHFAPTTPDLLLPSSSPPNNTSSNTNTTSREKDGQQDEEKRPINRAALGRRVFGSSSERQRDRKILNGIIHPAVRWAMAKSIFHHWIRGQWAVVLDIPLLYDSRLDIFTPTILMVAASPDVQMQRLRIRDPHLSPEEARDRVASQGGVDEKVKRTEARGRGRGYVIWNDGSREELKERVGEVMKELERGRKGWWSWRGVFLACWPVTVLWCFWEVSRGWWGRKQWEVNDQRKGE